MTGPRPGTCATCRFVGYTRRPGEQPADLTCANSEIAQVRETHEPVFHSNSSITVTETITIAAPFIPPNLAFGCNRWAERAPDVGMVPVRLGGPPAWRSVPDEPLADARPQPSYVSLLAGPKPC